MNTSTKTEQHTPTHEQVSVLAYQLWKKAGSRLGHDLEHWLEAEKQLTAFLATRQKQTPETRAIANHGSRRGGNGRAVT